MMNDITDRELLEEFAARGDERALAEVLRRYAGLVFGAALRRLGDHGMAEEAAQNVFTTLARKAAALAEHPALAAWLQKTAAFEAARAQEKELNRRRTMQAYQNDQIVPESNAEAMWHAALPLLDDAVASLSEPDRQVLLLRYWQSQPFKRIAAALGSTAAACEKRAERALEKLSRRLRRRGVVLGTAALGAGLTPALTKAVASPALLARLIPAALAAAKVPAGTAAAWFSVMLMKSKLTLFAAALALVAICGTAGWLTSRAQARSSQNTARASAGKLANATTSPASGNRELLADAANGQRRQHLRDLLEAVQRDLLTADFDPVAKARAAARVAGIASADMRAALDLAAEMPGGLRGQAELTAMLLQHWAESDGPAACEFALTRVPPPQMGLPPVSDPLKVWAAQDPAAAMAWFRQRASKTEKAAVQTDQWIPISSIRWIMGAWSLKDMPGAVQAFLALKDKQEIDGAMTGFVEMSGGAQGRTPLLDAVMTLKKDEHQENLLMEVGRLLERWSTERPVELAQWLDKQNVPKSYHGSLGKSVLKGWLREDAPAAVQWWLNAPGGYPERAGRTEDIVSAWTETDVFAAAEWLASQPLDDTAARSMQTLSGKIAASDPERGWEWALRISQEVYRKDALKQVIASWAREDKAAAAKAVEAASLSDALKTELQQTIESTKP